MLGHDIYRASSYGAGHPLRIPRVSTVMDLSRALGWLPPGRFRTSPRAKPAALTGFHTPDYLAALEAAETDGAVSEAVRARHGLGTTANPVFPEVWRRPATSAGGSLLAGELLARGGVVYHPAGGTHHAFPDRAAGFCYLNDPVLAMLSLRRSGARRLAYVDIDAHHGDGVEAAFEDDPDTLVISVHEERRWPFTGALEDEGAGQVFNLPVPRGLNDDEMAAIRDELILPRVAAFRPDAVVLQCGADGVEEDPLSRLSLSNNAHWAVVAALRPLSPRYLVLGGGGYNPWSVGRLWTGVWATLSGAEIPDRLPPAGEAILRALVWHRPGRPRPTPPAWLTTLRDAPRHGPVRAEVRAGLRALAGRR
ncbi:MAG: acetoin utilization protein AcuC [Paracoccaceae bacterium]|nr:acetoin utilization protein AcuC [Paracoccaceae bacterium]